jgi:hypothetical protein
MPFINELFKYINNVFLETGTFKGDTLFNIANNKLCSPEKIISLELSDIFYDNCLKRFKNNSNIVLYKANSKYDLYNIIQDIDQPITFWLDSHWSGTPNVGCDTETVCPIIEELEQIKQHYIKTHTIMIDDIRLMNNSNIKEQGFPITLDQIIKIIYEINPKYTIKYYDDYTSSKDILVAYIDKNNKNDKNDKICIHKYLTKCKTNPQSPGFADYLRGTIALFNLSKKYGYNLLLDNTHILFKFLLKNNNIVSNIFNDSCIELLPPVSYNEIYNKLNNLFNEGKIFTIMTNSFYTINNENKNTLNWGKITDECKVFLKDILRPSEELNNNIEKIINTVYNIKMFKIIQLRFGDKFIHNNIYDDTLYNLYYEKIKNLVNNNKDINYVLISDSSIISNKLKNNIQGLYYWDNKKIHIGDLYNNSDSDSDSDSDIAIRDTLTDFFIMSKSNEIISNGSGFSTIVSEIYNIKYSYI